MCLYVDGMLIMGSYTQVSYDTKIMLKRTFVMKDMGLADVIFGMKI